MPKIIVEGPFFEDFIKGEYIEQAPSVTLTEGHAVAHQMLFGDRLRLPLDHVLGEKITGSKRALANPSMVVNTAIGQTTYASQHVIGNLFYRGLVFKRPVYLGDTLTTSTKVELLKQNSIKRGRISSGLVVLKVRVTNQNEEDILNFWRCPMIPCRNQKVVTGHADDLSQISATLSETELKTAAELNWNLAEYRRLIKGVHFNQVEEAAIYLVKSRDTVTNAPELARLTLNLAATHTDGKASVYGQRLVYGGHTISVAFAQLIRVFPNIVTLLGWQHCDHKAAVFEDDILHSEVTVINKQALNEGGMVSINVKVFAERSKKAPASQSNVQVLDWNVIVLMA